MNDVAHVQLALQANLEHKISLPSTYNKLYGKGFKKVNKSSPIETKIKWINKPIALGI